MILTPESLRSLVVGSQELLRRDAVLLYLLPSQRRRKWTDYHNPVIFQQFQPLILGQVQFLNNSYRFDKLPISSGRLVNPRAVDPTMVHVINDISLNATEGIGSTLDATLYLLNYAHSHPNAEIIYRASDMILRVDSNAAYLVTPEARSRIPMPQ